MKACANEEVSLDKLYSNCYTQLLIYCFNSPQYIKSDKVKRKYQKKNTLIGNKKKTTQSLDNAKKYIKGEFAVTSKHLQHKSS